MRQIKIYTFLFTTAVLVAMTSCKRCYQCVVLDQNDDVAFGYKEICERPNALDEYEQICKDGVKDAHDQLSEDDDTTQFRCECGSDLDF